jgi:HAD superfamily hydrolase (TIGR01458 family)
MSFNPKQIRGVLFDLDGTLTVDWKPLPQAIATLKQLRAKGMPFRICTNTTTLSAASMTQRLAASGLPVVAADVFSAPAAAAAYLRRRGLRSCRLLLTEDTRRDFTAFETASRQPQALVIGDIGSSWDYALMQSLFDDVMAGAEIIALHKGKYWLSHGRLCLDIGAFIAGLEYVTRRTATIIGKPAREFFELALRDLGLTASDVLMIGDDLDNDIAGAQTAGIAAALVKTGKFDARVLETTTVRADLSAADVGEVLQALEL